MCNLILGTRTAAPVLLLKMGVTTGEEEQESPVLHKQAAQPETVIPESASIGAPPQPIGS